MVELTIEQKAKAYDKALERAKSVDDPEWLSPRDVAKYIFPELKESYNNRVRNKLIEFFKGYYPDKEWWGNITQRDILTWFEEHGEQISNFKVGDIIKRPNNKVTYEVTNIDDHGFQLDGGHWFKLDRKSEFNLVEQKPWSEEDEREVDILKAYICSREWSDSHIDRALGIVDELVKKLKDLKNRVLPQSNQEWSEEDEYLLDETIKHLEALIRITKKQGSAYSDEIQYYQRDIDWLKLLKDRVFPQPKHEWSEEDKVIRNALIKFVELLYSYGSGIYDLDKKQFLDWLQKLENRISK